MQTKTTVVLYNLAYPRGINWAIENNVVELPENVDVKFINMQMLNQMIATGEADIGAPSVPAFLTALNMNKDLKIAYPIGKFPIWMITQENSNITLMDLKGKTIVVGGLKFMTTSVLIDVLEKKYNITSSEITLVTKPVAVIPMLIERGDIEVGLVGLSQFPTVENLNLKVLVDLSNEFYELYGGYPISVVMAVKGNLDKELVKEIMDTLNNAQQISFENSEEVVKWYQEKHGIDIPDFIVYKDVGFRLIQPWDENNKYVLQRQFEICKEHGIVEEIPNLEDVIMELE